MSDDLIKQLEMEADLRAAQDLRVYVVGGGVQYIQMFHQAGLKGARSVDDANILCFTGGEDVDPDLYGEKPHPTTHFNRARDDREAEIYGMALAAKKPMVGICRGGQFLNVMNGGSMYQHVNGHATYKGHSILDCTSGEEIDNMTSTHHQMMIPGKDCEILALGCEATSLSTDKKTIEKPEPTWEDYEVLWYPDTLSLCFQPHPEFAHGNCRNYFLHLVDEYILPAT